MHLECALVSQGPATAPSVLRSRSWSSAETHCIAAPAQARSYASCALRGSERATASILPVGARGSRRRRGCTGRGLMRLGAASLVSHSGIARSARGARDLSGAGCPPVPFAAARPVLHRRAALRHRRKITTAFSCSKTFHTVPRPLAGDGERRGSSEAMRIVYGARSGSRGRVQPVNEYGDAPAVTAAAARPLPTWTTSSHARATGRTRYGSPPGERPSSESLPRPRSAGASGRAPVGYGRPQSSSTQAAANGWPRTFAQFQVRITPSPRDV